MGSALSRRGRHFRPRRGRHFRAPIGTSNVVLGLRLFMALAIGAATLTAATASSRPASASPNYTFTNETFQEPSFPPAGWQAEFSDFGPWAAHCPAVTPATGCSAQASATSGAAGMDRLLFNGTSPIPSDLTNVTLSFYSDFTTDATTSGDTAMVGQASVNGSSGDFNFLATVFGTGPNQTNDPSGTPTLHTIPLTSLNLPLAFMWSSPGDTAASPTKTWAISNVVISGTLPATTLTANPIPNTQYHVVAGTPITLTLTGSSNPAGDPLNFAITTPPTVGTLGAITPVNSTSATVVYTAPTTSCPDPNGTPGVICPDSFKFDVSDGGGNVSSPANVALDVNPGGAGGQQVVITAPASENYVTIGQPGGGTTQGADLSGAVSVGPSNFPDEIELHVQAATGTIDLHNAAASGVVFTNGTSSPGTEIDMKGSAAKINTAVGLFQYFPPSGTTPTTTIKLFADDLGATGQGNFTVQTQATVNINGPNNSPAPVLSLPTGNEAIATNAGPLTFPPGAATGISFADAGATGTTQDTVPLGVSGGTLAFPAADTSGGTQLVTVTGNGSSSLTVVGTVAHLNQALADLTFDPSGLPSETVTFTAQVFDPDTTKNSPQGSFPIKVTEAPFGFGVSSFTTQENVSALVFLCGAGPTGDPLTFAITTPTGHGTLVLDPSASAASSGCSPHDNVAGYTYTPATGYIGPDSFAYTVHDTTTNLTSAPATVTITVGAHNKPTAFPETAATKQDQPVDIVLCGTNPDPSPPLTFTITGPPAFGTVVPKATQPTVNACNQGTQAMTFTYTPNHGAFTQDGTDAFVYAVSNGAQSDPVSVTITVTTRTPQVFSENLTVNENGSVGFNLCSTVPNGAVTFSTFGPNHGTLDQVNAPVTGPACPPGYFGQKFERYVPNTLFSGLDTFGYSASDGTYTSANALVQITVNKIEIPPTATSQTVVDIAPQPVAITLAGASVQNSSLTFRVVNPPSQGTLTGTAPNLAYTPSVASGQDSFTFVANDGVADSPPATVTITIVTPKLSSSVCLPGAMAAGTGPFDEQFDCAGTLPTVPDGSGGQIALAHTSGDRLTQLNLQVIITNQTAAPDAVTITGPAGTSPWGLDYSLAGSDVTAGVTGTGVVVTLGPAGSKTASAFLQVHIFPPLHLATPTTRFTIKAVSGNNPSLSTSLPVEVADGTSSPALRVAQADGTGAVTFPTNLAVTPTMYVGGPAGGAVLIPDIAGTGDNTFHIQGTIEAGSTPGIGVQFFLGSSTDVTSQVEAGTFTIECFAGVGCPPMHVVLTPGSGSGFLSVVFSEVSVIDGQSSLALLTAQVASTVGPDLFTILPSTGEHVFEPTPVTEVATQAVQTSGTATQDVFLHNTGPADTFTLKAIATLPATDPGAVTIKATPPGSYGANVASSDVTAAVMAGTYQIKMGPDDYVTLAVTDAAGPTPGLAPANVVLTATSLLASTKVDSFGVNFPTYFYRPDAVLTGNNHQPIGVGVYDTKVGDIGSPNLQTDLWDIDALPTNINVTFADRGKGPWPANDAVVVKAPAFSVPGFSFSAGATGPPPADTSFILSYSMTTGGVTTDVTSAVTSAAGLPLTLGRDGTLPQTLVVTAKTSTGAPAGHPGYVDISVSSTNSTPPGLSDNVLIQLYSTGQSQLRFAGLPQPEPMDITQSLTAAELAARTGPFPSVGYAPGAFYGAFPDATGQKFAYVSAWDNFGFQVFGNKVSATAYRVQMVDPATTCTPEAGGAFGCNVGPGLPAWERSAFGQPYSDHQVPGGIGQYMDPLGGNGMNGLGGTPVNLHPKIMAGGQDVTAAVEAGTYTTPSLGTYQTTDLTVSFSPPAGDSQRYSPLKFNLINASTGEVEDVMVIGLSTIFSCTSDGGGQQLATITGPSGQKEHLSFRAFDRTGTSGAIDCLQHLSHSWISKVPLVFSSYVPATANTGAGGDNPNGLWLAPQFGALIRVDTDTLRVTSTYAKSYVDTPILGDDGQPDPSVPSPAYDYVGDFPNLVWNTTDGTNGLPVNANSPMGASPFPLIQPSQNEWPNNTMAAQRYFQVDTVTGTPLMVGEMRINEPWYQGDIPFLMPVDNTTGLTLAYGAPVNVTASLPGDNSTTTYGMYWVTRKDGTVIQGGCLGLPPAFFNLLHVDKSICFIGVTTTFKPIPSDPSQEAKIAQVTIFLKPVGFVVGTPEFNLKNLAGQIDLDPASGQVQDVKLEANFGVGPPTPCQVEKNARKAAGIAPTVEQRIEGSSCPSNYFFYNAKITFKQGGFTSDNATTGYGIRFDGTLSLFGDFNLSNIVADISTSPFNFHFENSAIDVSVPAIALNARITLSGDVGALGFDIGLSGTLSVLSYNIASASGVLSSKGFGLCGGVGGLSVGFGEVWGDAPTVYPSGCTTSQFQIEKVT